MVVTQGFRPHLERATKGAFSGCVVEAFLVGGLGVGSRPYGGVCPRL